MLHGIPRLQPLRDTRTETLWEEDIQSAFFPGLYAFLFAFYRSRLTKTLILCSIEIR
jgi:hypothetical protein